MNGSDLTASSVEVTLTSNPLKKGMCLNYSSKSFEKGLQILSTSFNDISFVGIKIQLEDEESNFANSWSNVNSDSFSIGALMIPIKNLVSVELLNQYFIERLSRIEYKQICRINKFMKLSQAFCILNLDDLCHFKNWIRDFPKDGEYTLIKGNQNSEIYDDVSYPISFLADDISSYKSILSKMKIIRLHAADGSSENIAKLIFILLSLKSLQDNVTSIELDLYHYSSCLTALKICGSCPKLKSVSLIYRIYDMNDQDPEVDIKKLLFKLQVFPKLIQK